MLCVIPRPRAVLPAAALAALVAGGCSAFDSIPRGAESVTQVFSGPTPAEAAEMALDEYNPDNRFRGVQLLSNADFGGNEPYMRLYVDAVTDADAGVRWAGVRALGRHGNPEHVEMIVGRLNDKDTLVRAEAARALQRLHDPAAVDALIRSTEPDIEPEPSVRAEAAHALGQYAQTRVVQALIERLDDPSLAVNRNTLEALTTLTGQDFKYDRRAWLDWADGAGNLFAAKRPYTYPVFARDKNLLEWLPFMSPPPNEAESTPVGMMPDGAS
ncbi:MAG: hypothetical protein DHS20C14_21840 [Phycisphaeraceae bacterium]|nr:MAG: hypothetical protein DHS20C14_21840 [Phycisphaeraceae bacterium]